MFYGASLLYGASLISPRFTSWLVNELLVFVLEVTPRLYAKIIARRAERKSPRQVKSHSSYQHSFYGVDTRTHSGVQTKTHCRVK